jgi:trans-2,3-dihydro-3-hydroxyanthranilate isomerase
VTVDFLQVDVFADGPFRGNPLAVYPQASELDATQMQTIAAEMNLSETAFVTEYGADSYSVRIFTPREELPFAGHPTLGTAWVLRHLGLVTADRVVQRSAAGDTTVTFGDDAVWFQRTGRSSPDLRGTDERIEQKIARAVGLELGDIGLEPRELGRSVNSLHPAVADAGLKHLIVPVRDAPALARCRPVAHLLDDLSEAHGAYCFTALGAGAVRARGFFPSLGIEEDPATGSAAACLGIYLASRIGPIDLDIAQGIEMGRPSRMRIKSGEDTVHVGGSCELIFEGSLKTVP